MAVKIRLEEWDRKKLLSIESLLQIPDLQEMVNSSTKSELMIQIRTQVYTK